MRRFECDLCRDDNDPMFRLPCVLIVADATDTPDVCPWSWSDLDLRGKQAEWREIHRQGVVR